MFTALGLLFLGIAAGFALRGRLDAARCSRCVTPVVMLLLFFLGVAVGGNDALMADLPRLGGAALVLTAGGLAGSLFVVRLLCRSLRPVPPAGQGTAANRPGSGTPDAGTAAGGKTL